MKKRFLSLVITLTTVLCMFTMFSEISFAEVKLIDMDPDMFGGGNGTEESPYEIATLEQMEYLASITSRETYYREPDDLYFKLTADIGSEDEPLRTCIFRWGDYKTNRFFDGNGKTVYVDIEYKEGEIETSGIGLFANCQNATIKNLTIEGRIDADSYSRVGGVCGMAMYNVDISDCVNNAVITGKSYVGGICGDAGDTTNISSCMNNGNITGSSEVGGICGNFYDELTSSGIYNCWNTGNVTAYKGDAGGICSKFVGERIAHCNNKAAVEGGGCVGGICGNFEGKIMEHCSTQGGVKATSHGSGGLLCGRVSSHVTMYWCCAAQSGKTQLIESKKSSSDIKDSVVIILPGKFIFEFPQNLEEAKALENYSVLRMLNDYYYWNHNPGEDGIYYTYEPTDEPVSYSLYDSSMQDEGSEAWVGSVFSGGSLEILYGIGGLAVGFAAAMLIFRKKKVSGSSIFNDDEEK